MARRKGKADDPIMWEVDEDGNEIGAEPVEAAKKKGKDKSKDLLKSMNRSSADKPMTAKQRKELERKEYGDLDDSEDENGGGGNSDSDVDLPGVNLGGDASASIKKRAYRKKEKGYFANVKWSHVMVLVMMTGGALIPFLMMAGDLLGPKISAAINNVVPSLQPVLVGAGLTSAPKKRLGKFYEKHNPKKMDEVEKILKKYAGDYKSMTKKLESKYNDYGFFMNWEDEEGFRGAQKQTYAYVSKTGGKLYQKYIPFPIRMGLQRAYSNALFAYTKAYKTIDKWTNPSSSSSGSSRSSSGRSSNAPKSRRARNKQARDD